MALETWDFQPESGSVDTYACLWSYIASIYGVLSVTEILCCVLFSQLPIFGNKIGCKFTYYACWCYTQCSYKFKHTSMHCTHITYNIVYMNQGVVARHSRREGERRRERPGKMWLNNKKDWKWLSVDNLPDSTQNRTKWQRVVAETSIRHPNDNLGQDIEVDDEDIVNIVQTFDQPMLILDVLRLEITCHCHPRLEIHFFLW